MRLRLCLSPIVFLVLVDGPVLGPFRLLVRWVLYTDRKKPIEVKVLQGKDLERREERCS